MSIEIKITASDGHVFDAWRSEPTGAIKGGVVILHAITGRIPHLADVCDQWASEGYVAVAPSLFDRIGPNIINSYEPEGVEAGIAYYTSLDGDKILIDTDACAETLRSYGPVVISGFCTGGTWAWVSADKLKFDAMVNYYGSHVPARLEYKPRCPSVIHYGDIDHCVSMEEIETIRAANPELRIHIHPGAKHAFFNPEQKSFHPEAAPKSWIESMAFLDEVLG
jgi:carboxymethylenebutenolidase